MPHTLIHLNHHSRKTAEVKHTKRQHFQSMGSLFSPLFLLFTLFSYSPSPSSSQPINSPRMLDLLIRDYATNLSSPAAMNIKTGVPKTINLPVNLSGIAVTAIRLRCGSLRRYGAQIKEFHLPANGAVAALPCIERILFIHQQLAQNWSKIYYQNYDFRGYRLISPILGLLAYNAGDDINRQSNPFELGVYARAKNPIKIDFGGLGISSNISRAKHYCATFESGKMKLLNMVAPLVCVAEKEGHFALVAEAPPRAPPGKRRAPERGTSTDSGNGGRESRWKLAVGCSVGAALGAFLLGLLLIAMLVRAKQRTKVEEERVRRAYEEEALQVSMVGHVRAPVAAGSRTAPAIEHHYRPPRL